MSKSLLIAQEEKKIELIPPKDDDNSKNYILSVTNEPCLNLKVLNLMVKVLKGYSVGIKTLSILIWTGFKLKVKTTTNYFQ